jgi:predicted dienelactone hydrolase
MPNTPLRKSSLRSIALASALITGVGLAACGGGGSGPRDPASPGPYGVGMATMTFTRPSTTTGQPRPLETVIWYPIDAGAGANPRPDAPPATRGGPFPVVTFSHGDAGTPKEASYFTEHLASWGFVVVAPAHFGNRTQDCPCSDAAFADSLFNRVPDITFVVDSVLALKKDPEQPIGRIIDTERIADTGYSYGGLTAMSAALVGRFDVVIAMAPGAPSLLLDAAKKTRVPTLLMAGGRDERVDADGVRALYDVLPADLPRYYLRIPQAGHHAFRNECKQTCEFPQARAHELVDRYATAFLEVYLVGDQRFSRYLEQSDPPDALLEHAVP